MKISEEYGSPVRAAPKVIPLYNEGGQQHQLVGNPLNNGVYVETISGGGGGVAKFFINQGGEDCYKLAKVAFRSSSSVNIIVTGKYYIAGEWVEGGMAWNPSVDQNLQIPAGLSTKWNPMFPEEVMWGTPFCLEIATDGATTIFCQMIEG